MNALWVQIVAVTVIGAGVLWLTRGTPRRKTDKHDRIIAGLQRRNEPKHRIGTEQAGKPPTIKTDSEWR